VSLLACVLLLCVCVCVRLVGFCRCLLSVRWGLLCPGGAGLWADARRRHVFLAGSPDFSGWQEEAPWVRLHSCVCAGCTTQVWGMYCMCVCVFCCSGVYNCHTGLGCVWWWRLLILVGNMGSRAVCVRRAVESSSQQHGTLQCSACMQAHCSSRLPVTTTHGACLPAMHRIGRCHTAPMTCVCVWYVFVCIYGVSKGVCHDTSVCVSLCVCYAELIAGRGSMTC
jgi:hypothetical protein